MTHIVKELKQHIPFTAFGALTGIIFMLLFYRVPHDTAHRVFYVFHPMHVVLSAMVTASMYRSYQCGRYGGKCSLWQVLIIGYAGSIGIATLSDSLIPYLGETLLGLPNKGLHLGFIEEWWIVNPAAVLGVGIAHFATGTKFPHAGHVLLSTWASLFHVIMALGGQVSLYLCGGIFIFLFLSVWFPCCLSDIVFPLLFVKNKTV